MKTNRPSVRPLLAFATLTFLLSACAAGQHALTTPTYVVAQKFNIRTYSRENVSLLPIVVSPAFGTTQLPLAKIRDAIVEQLARVPVETKVLADRDAPNIAMQYPLTPRRIRQYLNDHPLSRAAIGISILEWRERTPYRPASVEILVCFSDKDTPEHSWTLVKEWSIEGGQLSTIDSAISRSLSFEFMDLGRFLRRGKRSWITMSENQETVGDPSNFLAVTARDLPPAVTLETSRPFVDLSIAAGFDGGIDSISVSGPQSLTNHSMSLTQTPSKDFTSFVIRVPSLSPGLNSVKVVLNPTARDKAPIQREISVLRSKSTLVRTNMVTIVLQSRNTPNFGRLAAEVREGLDLSDGTWHTSGRVTEMRAESQEEIVETLRDLRDSSDQYDVGLVYLAARVRDAFGSVYLVPTNDSPEGNRYFVDDVNLQKIFDVTQASTAEKLTVPSNAVTGVADLCFDSDSTSSDAVKAEVKKMTPPNWAVSLVECTAFHDGGEEGALGRQFSDQLRTGPHGEDKRPVFQWLLNIVRELSKKQT
jgi:hypothetical protein